MNIHTIILVSCVVVAVTSSSIDESATVGKNVHLGENVTIKAHANIGDSAEIGSSTSIGENTNVGQYVRIKDHCSFRNQVKIDEFAKFNSYSSVGSKSEIGILSDIGKSTTIKNGVVIKNLVKVGDKSVLEDGVRIDNYVGIGENNHIKANAYFGNFTKTKSKVTVGESAIIHNYVHIPEGKTINPNEILLRTPSSYDLYKMFDPSISESATPDINKKLGELINGEFNALNTECSKSDTPIKPKSLPKIISLYLIQYHGLESFKENLLKLQEKRWTLDAEYHFGKQAQKNILDADVTGKFVQLMATDLDAMRTVRSQNDTFCTVLKLVVSAQRSVICAERDDRAL